MNRTALKVAVACVALATIVGVRPAQGVWYNPGIGIGYGRGVGLGYGVGYGYGLYGGYGYGGYGWGGGGTAAANYAQGMSQVIRAQGQYNKDTAESKIKYEEARTKYIDNQKKWSETYFAMREENQAKQAAKFEKSRYSQETLTQAARSGIPKPLSGQAYDPISGRVTWPETLQTSEYAETRKDVEQLLELRASTSSNGGSGGYSAKIHENIEKMIAILKGNIHNLPTHDYISARKFLDSLAYTVRS
jgi:hypothetical protein